MLLSARYYFLILSLVISFTSAEKSDAEWFGSDEVTTKSTTTYGNRRTKLPTTWEYTPRTRKSTTPSAEAWSESDEETTKRTTPTTHGNGGTTSFTTWEYTSRTRKPTTVRPAVEFGTSSTGAPPSTFVPSDFIDTIVTLLKNFAKLFTTESSLLEGNGNEYFVSVLKLEIFTMASGNRFIVPPSADTAAEEKLQKNAGGLTSLWLDLFCTERIDSIVENVTRETVVAQHKSPREPLTTSAMQETLRSVFSKLNDAIEADSFLAALYGSRRAIYSFRHRHTSTEEGKVYIPFDDVARGRVDGRMVDAWTNELDVRKYLIHRQFLDLRKDGKGNKSDSAWVRSVLEVGGESCCLKEMQDIYTKALNETALNFTTADFPRGTIRTLVDKVTAAVEPDGSVKKWLKQQNNTNDTTPWRRILKSR